MIILGCLGVYSHGLPSVDQWLQSIAASPVCGTLVRNSHWFHWWRRSPFETRVLEPGPPFPQSQANRSCHKPLPSTQNRGSPYAVTAHFHDHNHQSDLSHRTLAIAEKLLLPLAHTLQRCLRRWRQGNLPAPGVRGWTEDFEIIGRKLMLGHRFPHVGIVFLLVVSGRFMCQQFMKCADAYPVGWFLLWFMDQHEKLINIGFL